MTPVLLREVRANAEAPLIASSETRRQRLVKPEEDEGEQVGLAPPDGLGNARPTFVIEGDAQLVMELLAA